MLILLLEDLIGLLSSRTLTRTCLPPMQAVSMLSGVRVESRNTATQLTSTPRLVHGPDSASDRRTPLVAATNSSGPESSPGISKLTLKYSELFICERTSLWRRFVLKGAPCAAEASLSGTARHWCWCSMLSSLAGVSRLRAPMMPPCNLCGGSGAVIAGAVASRAAWSMWLRDRDRPFLKACWRFSFVQLPPGRCFVAVLSEFWRR